MQRTNFVLLTVLLVLVSGVGPVCAVDRIVEAGGTLTLEANLVLTGSDTLELRGTTDRPCTLDGAHHKIRTKGKWTGRVRVVHGRIKRLGSKDNYTPDRRRLLPDCEAIILEASGRSEVVFEHCVFEECNSVEIVHHNQSLTR